jgi:hypothetical protein
MTELTYNETMALASIIGNEIRGDDKYKKTEWICYYETIGNVQHGQQFHPFDPRWCGAYLQWLADNVETIVIERIDEAEYYCHDDLHQYKQVDSTPNEAVARCVLAVMRERGMVK